MRARFGVLLALSALVAAPASAGLAPDALARVEFAPPPGARVPLGLVFRNMTGAQTTLGQALAGRPALMVFVDDTCRSLCGAALDIAAAGLARVPLRPGADYGLIVVGIDPKDGPGEAAAMARDHLGSEPELLAASRFLSGDAETIRLLTAAVGYSAVYDAEHDQFAHPTGALALTAEGRVARMLSGLGLEADGLRLALVEAGEGRIGGLGDRIRLLCYGYDAIHGLYTPLISRLVRICGILTVAALALFIFLLQRSARRAASGRPS